MSLGDSASSSDSELAKALRARIATVDDKTKSPVLGKDEIGAEHMAPHDVVRFVMNALKRSPEDGVTALLQFSAQTDGMEQLDFVGQLQPGAFSPEALLRYFETEPRYQALSAVSESKAMGQPELKHNAKKAVQKLLVRREGVLEVQLGARFATDEGVGHREEPFRLGLSAGQGVFTGQFSHSFHRHKLILWRKF